ncbi:MAG: hypothetical protein ABI780_09910 [Ardenticatenales bacterium]
MVFQSERHRPFVNLRASFERSRRLHRWMLVGGAALCLVPSAYLLIAVGVPLTDFAGIVAGDVAASRFYEALFAAMSAVLALIGLRRTRRSRSRAAVLADPTITGDAELAARMEQQMLPGPMSFLGIGALAQGLWLLVGGGVPLVLLAAAIALAVYSRPRWEDWIGMRDVLLPQEDELDTPASGEHRSREEYRHTAPE